MSKSDFPLFLSEVEVAQYFGFHFSVPKADIGREDIIICIEYEQVSPGQVRYHAWGQIRDSYVRAYLLSSFVAGSDKSSNIIPKIMFDINSSKAFYQSLDSFISHFERV